MEAKTIKGDNIYRPDGSYITEVEYIDWCDGQEPELYTGKIHDLYGNFLFYYNPGSKGYKGAMGQPGIK